jgi:negative regulator of replication initiation
MGRRRFGPAGLNSRTIRVDDEVYAWLQSKAVPFRDGPNTVLRKLMAEELARKARRATASEREAS